MAVGQNARKVGGSAGNRGKGRKKGVPNRLTKSAREAMELAFQGIGGVSSLTKWAKDNQTEFYKLFSRLIPVQTEHTGKDGAPLEIVFRHE